MHAYITNLCFRQCLNVRWPHSCVSVKATRPTCTRVQCGSSSGLIMRKEGLVRIKMKRSFPCQVMDESASGSSAKAWNAPVMMISVIHDLKMFQRTALWSIYFAGFNGNRNISVICLLDLMKLRTKDRSEKTTKVNTPKNQREVLISRLASGPCFDFHPKVTYETFIIRKIFSFCHSLIVFYFQDSNIYLAGTEEGEIHKCSYSYSEQFLETYQANKVCSMLFFSLNVPERRTSLFTSHLCSPHISP